MSGGSQVCLHPRFGVGQLKAYIRHSLFFLLDIGLGERTGHKSASRDAGDALPDMLPNGI